MKKTCYILFILICSKTASIYSQTCFDCLSNLSFENGDFSDWSGTYGNYVFNLPTPVANPNYSFVPAGTGTPVNRYTITTGTVYDPNIPSLPVVAPCGGNYSARIGCACAAEAFGVAGAQPYFESLSDTITVTAQNNYFTYMYALVMLDGNHDRYTNPSFEVIMTKYSDGSLLPFGQYFTYPGRDITEFLKLGPYNYTNWISIATDLTNYIGEKIYITFRVHDCMGNLSSMSGNYSAASGGSHLGYAYIDTYCSSTSTTDIAFVLKHNDLTIHPNPSNSTAIIKTGNMDGVYVTIYNISGELIETKYLNNYTVSINVDPYIDGVYFCQLKGKNNEILRTEKFTVLR